MIIKMAGKEWYLPSSTVYIFNMLENFIVLMSFHLNELSKTGFRKEVSLSSAMKFHSNTIALE